MVSMFTVVGVAVSVYLLLVTVAVLYLTYLSTKQDYTAKTEDEKSAA